MSWYWKRRLVKSGYDGKVQEMDVLDPMVIVRDGVIALTIVVVVSMAGCPQYAVYEQRLTGESELARAQQNRQIAVNEAQAKMDAAKLLAQAEVERAKGVAQANQIIAQGLKGNEEYLRYLWITDVAGNNKGASIIYVPTEANLPILEASRHVATIPSGAVK